MIIEAAILKDGIIYTGRRHHNIIWTNPKGFFYNCEQGFVTDTGEFVNRFDAGKIAIACGQIKALQWGNELYSEDLY